MKRKNYYTGIISFALSLLLCITAALFPAEAQAAENAKISVAALSATPGKTVACEVSISENPGLTGFNIKLKYDPSVMSPLVSDKIAECESGEVTESGNLMCSSLKDGEVNVYWSDAKDAKEDGTLFSVPFKLSEDAAPGEYEIEASYVPQNTINRAEERIALDCENGKLTVREFVPKLIGETRSVRAGESFDYEVLLEDNPGLSSVRVQLYFDRNAFALVRAGDAKPGTDEAAVALTAQGDEKLSGAIVGKGYADAAEIQWYRATNSYADGVLFRLHMRAKEDAEAGEHTIRLQVMNDGNVVNEEQEDVVLASVDGLITLEARTDRALYSAERSAATGKLCFDVDCVSESAKLIAAVYGKNGRLLEIRETAVTKGEGQKIDVARRTAKTPGESVKAFLLDGQNKPLGKA